MNNQIQPTKKPRHSIDKQSSSPTAHTSLRHVRTKLSRNEKYASKLLHSSKIELLSDIASETIARPSGLLWGGIFFTAANIGTLLFCRYYGYEYNYLIGIFGFLLGYLTGVILESSVKAFKKILKI